MLYRDYSRAPASGSRTSTAAARTSRRSPSCSELNAVTHGQVPGVIMAAEESTAWPGRLAPDLDRRARLRLQVEHGLDARHARLLPRAIRSTAPTTTTSSPSACSTHSPRTSCCRSHTTRSSTARARCSRRCRATAGSSSRTFAPSTPTCGRIPGRSCCSWAASSHRSRNGATIGASTGTCSGTPPTPASTRSSAT